MLFVLNDELLHKDDEFFHNVAQALENMATGAREGKHILIGNRSLLLRLSQLPFISRLSSASISKCKEQLPEYAQLKEITSDFVEVIPEGHAHVLNIDHRRIINLPIHLFSDSSIIQETILLGENLLDSNFYRIVADAYIFLNNLNALKLRYDNRLGGGSTTIMVYRQIQDDNNRFCLCVADSDKQFPGDNLGMIAKRLAEIDDENRPISRCILLLCREAENMLSCRHLALPFSHNDQRIEALRKFEIIERIRQEARFYVDIKNGIKIKDVFEFPKDHPCRQYWIDCLSEIYRSCGRTTPCLSENCCLGEDEECECTIMPGFGDTILEQVINNLERNSIKKVTEMLSESVYREWMKIGQIVFSWCLGKSRRAAL